LLTEHVRINAAASQAYSYCKASQATSSNGHINGPHPRSDDQKHSLRWSARKTELARTLAVLLIQRTSLV
jgi:LPS sulfotransferase NodH